jgi:hypothetical protein
MVLVALAFTALHGCSKADNDYAVPPADAVSHAQAAERSIASAQAVQRPHAPGMRQEDDGAAQGNPTAGGARQGDGASTGMGARSDGARTGMARMLGQPPTVSGSSPTGKLLAPSGPPHLYALAADSFFLDQARALGLSGEQQGSLAVLKESAAMAYATTQRKIDQAEQDLWMLSTSNTPDLAMIEKHIEGIGRLTGHQRMDFIRALREAAGILTDAQRDGVVSHSAPVQPGTQPPAPSGSGMSAGTAPSSGSPQMGEIMKAPASAGPGSGMSPPGTGLDASADAGPAGGMGHM